MKTKKASATEKSTPLKLAPSVVPVDDIPGLNLKKWSIKWNDLLKKPGNALFEAHQHLQFGHKLLLELIKTNPTPNEWISTTTVANQAETLFCGHVDQMITSLRVLAQEGHYDPLYSAWYGSMSLAETIHDLALGDPPEELRRIARTALWMPSLRANQESYKYDSKKVTKDLQLSEESPLNMGPKAKYRLNFYPTRYVAMIIDKFTVKKREAKRLEQHFYKLQEIGAEGNQKANFKEYVQGLYPTETASDILFRLTFPAFSKETVDEWWERVIKPALEAPQFLESIRGSPFFRELEKAAMSSKGYSKDSYILERLRTLCYQVLKGRTIFRSPSAKS